MPDAGQDLETIGCGDASDCVVGIAPDRERRHPSRAQGTADRAAGSAMFTSDKDVEGESRGDRNLIK
jgi:hypothetical protein